MGKQAMMGSSHRPPIKYPWPYRSIREVDHIMRSFAAGSAIRQASARRRASGASAPSQTQLEIDAPRPTQPRTVPMPASRSLLRLRTYRNFCPARLSMRTGTLPPGFASQRELSTTLEGAWGRTRALRSSRQSQSACGSDRSPFSIRYMVTPTGYAA